VILAVADGRTNFEEWEAPKRRVNYEKENLEIERANNIQEHQGGWHYDKKHEVIGPARCNEIEW